MLIVPEMVAVVRALANSSRWLAYVKWSEGVEALVRLRFKRILYTVLVSRVDRNTTLSDVDTVNNG